jgi:nitrogen-specific signal transduction histidine kinase
VEISEIIHVLEKDFEATFIKELIPGILHNFANPLNGIMGRSKLLQRRIEENQKKIEEMYPDIAAGMIEEMQRIKSDIRAINRESEYFFDIFKDVAGKFYAIAAKNEDRINISQLLAAEMRFADFYLDFKHEIKKDVQLDSDVPDFRGIKADLSIAFWSLIRFAMSRAAKSSLKEFYIKTEYDNKYVSVFIKSSGAEIPPRDIEVLMDGLDKGYMDSSGSSIDEGLSLSLLLFSRHKARINIFSEENFTTVSIGFPYRCERPGAKKI